MEINPRKQKQTIYSNTFIGVHIVYKDKIKSNEEEITNDAIDRFIIRHKLDKNLNPVEVVKKMIEYYNSTLRPGESKRVLTSVFYIYNSKSYKKLKL